jgi:hypothetical protein
MKLVVCQRWLERERGWGTRPDGYSLHIGKLECQRYIKEYWDGMPPSAPDEYSAPVGDSYWCEVSDELYEEIVAGKGYRSYGDDYPEQC